MIGFRDKDLPVLRLEFESHLRKLRRNTGRDSARFPHLPFLPARFLLHLLMPVRSNPGFSRWFPFSLSVTRSYQDFQLPFFQAVPSMYRLIPDGDDLPSLVLQTRWLTNQIQCFWFLYLLFFQFRDAFAADWTRLGRSYNPIEFEFMGIWKRASRVMRIKEAVWRTNIFHVHAVHDIARSRFEHRDAIPSSTATVLRLHYTNQSNE